MGLFGLFNSKKSFQQSELLQGIIDRHTHILYGVDDGIKTLEDSLAALDFQESLGVKEIWCTPHIMEDVPNTTQDLIARFGELQAAYKGNIKLHLAAEYMLDTIFEERFKDGDILLMEDDTVLVETSTWTPPVNLYEKFREIQKAGYRPLFAHPERYRYLKESGYEDLMKMGIHFQLNLPALTGFYGDTAWRKALWLLEKGWYSDYGSDCHREYVIKQQYTREVLTKDVLKLLEKLLQR